MYEFQLGQEQSNRQERDPTDYFKVVLGYFGLALVVASGALFVDQSNKNKYKPIILPKDALEIEQVTPYGRRFAVTAPQEKQVVCGELNVGYKGTTYTRFMPVERTTEKIGANTILLAQNAQNSRATVDTIVTCSYPASDPAYIQKIPVKHQGQSIGEGNN